MLLFQFYFTNWNERNEHHPDPPQVADGGDEGNDGQEVADEDPEVGPGLVAHSRVEKEGDELDEEHGDAGRNPDHLKCS